MVKKGINGKRKDRKSGIEQIKSVNGQDLICENLCSSVDMLTKSALPVACHLMPGAYDPKL